MAATELKVFNEARDIRSPRSTMNAILPSPSLELLEMPQPPTGIFRSTFTLLYALLKPYPTRAVKYVMKLKELTHTNIAVPIPSTLDIEGQTKRKIKAAVIPALYAVLFLLVVSGSYLVIRTIADSYRSFWYTLMFYRTAMSKNVDLEMFETYGRRVPH